MNPVFPINNVKQNSKKLIVPLLKFPAPFVALNFVSKSKNFQPNTRVQIVSLLSALLPKYQKRYKSRFTISVF